MSHAGRIRPVADRFPFAGRAFSLLVLCPYPCLPHSRSRILSSIFIVFSLS